MVAPGIIDAGLGAAFLKDLYNPDIWETQRQRTALRRFGTGEEIAEAVTFLASERARYITGHTLMVDGGFRSEVSRVGKEGVGRCSSRRSPANSKHISDSTND